MRSWIIALPLFMLAGCGAAPQAAVNGAWVKLNAVPGRPAAAYLTLHAGDAPLTLTAARSPAAARAELHESAKDARGVMSMRAVPSVAVDAGRTVALEPGGKHIMLFDVNPALKAGDTTAITLSFADGKTIEAQAKVRAAGDGAP
ncbi:copper chaperone PCu(A)C [Sphingomonas sp. RS2018]